MKYTPFNFMCITIMILSTMMVLSSSNWMFLWAGMELNLLSFIPLILLTNSNQESEASIKYFLAQALGSSIMLMSSLSMWFYNSIPLSYMSVVLFVSLMLKIGMAPCHLWYPSVMTSISWMSCLILSTWQKLAPLAVITFIMSSTFSNSILILAAMNAIIGGAVGMNQVHLRTIMAYSSITHMGWMISLSSMNKLTTTMLYFMMYSILITPIFILFNKFSSNTSMDLNKLMSKAPFMQFMIPLLLLSLGGLPPLTGFMPKWVAIETLSYTNPYILILLIVGAMMNLYFYLNISFNMILTPPLSDMPNSKFYFLPSNLMIPMSTLILLSTPMFMLM
uniref:NADH-ubiquinone oxidoreductase chain 2 n=1 Tax=Mesenchytraeus cf. pedatus SL-2017 TaxID=2052678 RepID=A0A342Y111_9ANNE|nr:NADH dehydrogenase subunit 2 [Mesenchytraeus cf. pedatus SL-2017]